MKKNILVALFLLVFLVSPIVLPELFADAPPDPGGDPTGGNPVGGGSPIGGGLILMLSFGIAYATRKLFKNK
ncbi:MAG: hypothetical protein K9G76_01285 [Bacteroidales bacterium]|nr:hypothetical protein [Bacteroidales bacterium]MCF8403185.1 hypothetical protein [Bacteroidales bacterium]